MSRKYLHLTDHPLLSGEGNHAKDVLFLFNGMEKMKLDFWIGATELCSDPSEALLPSAVVVNLLRKYLLPEVKIRPKPVQCKLLVFNCFFIFMTGFLFLSEICFRMLIDFYHT